MLLLLYKNLFYWIHDISQNGFLSYEQIDRISNILNTYEYMWEAAIKLK
jgi:hypothetical protein